MVRSVPQEIATSHVDNALVDSKLVDKNENLMSFLQIFFSRPQYDRSGSIASLLPAELTVEALELLSSHASTSDQATQLRYFLSALADEVRHEKNYLSKSVDFLFLSPTVLKYMISTNFHLGAIDKSLDSIKKTFNMLALLAPPPSGSDDYERYIATGRNNELEDILEQPSDKRSAVKKEIFIKVRQESIECPQFYCQYSCLCEILG